ncbi:tRNA pseudouridine(55) synthase TruB [Arthrobacter sp. AET 35A]|nr:tRNA pseudouridine(55) synthase TruB [Arthrobacter sp. AET 35A]NOJ63104.1 tRNA pseudouridine(55) synthase TruB [Arthrobacter sp. 147(2020)]
MGQAYRRPGSLAAVDPAVWQLPACPGVVRCRTAGRCIAPILRGVNSGQVHSGLIIVDKPQGWTSHDVVSKMRRIAGTRKVGHAGTLDPMATGVLVVGINRATRLLTFVVGTSKTYTATIRLGQSTVTDDAEGDVVTTTSAAGITPEAISAGIADLTGDIEQVPSSVSAIKVKGQRAYTRVRSGEDVVLAARPVTIHRFELHDIRTVTGPDADGTLLDLDVTVECSSGTYIRALARDLGGALGVGGHLTALRRTQVGPYSLDQASTLEELAADLRLLPINDAARVLFTPRELSAGEALDLSHGRFIPAGDDVGPVAAFAPDGTLVALLKNSADRARPLLVFAPGNGTAVDENTSTVGENGTAP